MSIAERLRREVANFGPLKQDGCADLLTAAANEIERLETEAAEARRLSLELYTATTGPAVRRARA